MCLWPATWPEAHTSRKLVLALPTLLSSDGYNMITLAKKSYRTAKVSYRAYRIPIEQCPIGLFSIGQLQDPYSTPIGHSAIKMSYRSPMGLLYRFPIGHSAIKMSYKSPIEQLYILQDNVLYRVLQDKADKCPIGVLQSNCISYRATSFTESYRTKP